MQLKIDESIDKIINKKERLIDRIIEFDKQKYQTNVYNQLNPLIESYLRNYGAKNITAIVIRRYTCEKKHNNSNGIIVFDTRFGFYQYIRFKFLNREHVCSILPYLWFTTNFHFDPENNYYPEGDLLHSRCYNNLNRCRECTAILLNFAKIHAKILSDLESRKLKDC